MSKSDSNASGCKAKKGLLVLRDCGEPVIGVCSGCHIGICQKHQVIAFNNQVLCPDCAAKDQNMKPAGYVGRSRRRDRYYSHYGYTPWFYYHDHDHYRDHDYHSVQNDGNQPADAMAGAGAEPPGVSGGIDADDLDSMES
jgi:hypothetical protein